ncbi:MAG: type VI secretion system tube protein Hcp [Alphaproteobacteria bacterium]|nr:type VI secretion system tube protein Hcp [Alphaproteobacteria bacterium]
MAIYLQLDKVPGDSTHEKHKDWITIDRLEWGTSRSISTAAGSAANREASEPQVREVLLTKKMDCSSPKLFVESCTGNQGKAATIHLVMTGSPGETYSEIKLTNALVSSYVIVSDGGPPVERITLNFTKVEVKYIPFDDAHRPKSPIVTFYDLSTTKSG